jgi:hypothetical protein
MSPHLIIEHDGKRTTALELMVDGNTKAAVTLQASTDTYTRRMVTTSGTLSATARRSDGSWADPNADFSWLSSKIERDQLRKRAKVAAKLGLKMS